MMYCHPAMEARVTDRNKYLYNDLQRPDGDLAFQLNDSTQHSKRMSE